MLREKSAAWVQHACWVILFGTLHSCAAGSEQELSTGSEESALITTEDPKVTEALRASLLPLRNAVALGDRAEYEKRLGSALVDATRLSSAELLTRFASLEVIATDKLGMEGLQPLFYRYARSIIKAQVDSRTLSALRASPGLGRSSINPLMTAPACSSLVRNAFRSLQRDASEVRDLEGLACLYADPTYINFTLSSAGVSLPTWNACDSISSNQVYVLNLPSSVSFSSVASIEVENAPFPTVVRSYAHPTLPSVIVARDPWLGSATVPADAQSTTFQVRVTSTSNGITRYPVTLPVRSDIHNAQCSSEFPVAPGESVHTQVFGNGNSGTRVWSIASVAGSALPRGLSLVDGTGSMTGHSWLEGTVAATAVDGTVDIRFLRAGATTTRRFTIPVALTLDAARVSALSAVQVISRGQRVSMALPAASGGNGNYTWSLRSGALPAGLVLAGAIISGTVANNAALDRRNVELSLCSAGRCRYLTLTFESRPQIRTYTQNAFLFTPSIVPDDHTAWCIGASATASSILCGPLVIACAVGLTLECEDAIDGVQEKYINGTHANATDNAERRARLVEHISDENYDIVALQELWQAALNDSGEFENVNPPGYQRIAGPGPSTDLMEIFGSNPERAFRNNSGLLTLVRGPLTYTTSAYDHAQAFAARGGGNDGAANKGFVITRVYPTSNPDEYFWVINTHAHAGESAARAAQVAEIIAYVDSLSDTRHPFLLLGDLNVEGARPDLSTPGAEYTALMNGSLDGWMDIFSSTRADSVSWQTNAYTQMYHLDGDATRFPDKRIDYVLIRQGTAFALDVEYDSLAVVDGNLGAPGSAATTTLCSRWSQSWQPGTHCHYSDHFGLKANLRFRTL